MFKKSIFLSMLSLLIFVIVLGCAQKRIHSIYVADFEALSPQPEADILAQKIPDLIAESLEDKKGAEIISRQEINTPDLTVKGRIVNYLPAQGWQHFQSAHAFLTVVVEAHGKNASGEPVGYTKQFNFTNNLPEKGIFMAFLRSIGVLVTKVVTSPFGGLSAQEKRISYKASKDIDKLIKD
jgi:hypothetical protein